MPYSNYSKIQDLLRELGRLDGPQELNALAESIRSRQIESFAIWRAGEPGETPAKSYCSAEAIRRLARFVADLGLVAMEDGDRCNLARPGRNALTAGNYDKVLSTHLAMYLKEKVGVTYSEIKDALGAVRPPEVPSFDTIYRRLCGQRELGVPEEQFRAVLYLLERCGMLTTQIRKVYFAPEIRV
jgi:hypothetical protein